MLFTVQDVGFGGLGVTVLDEHFFYEVLDFLNGWAAIFAKSAVEFRDYLGTDFFGLFPVSSADGFGGFPNGNCDTFLIKRF
jgi:hypothetical protein